MINLIPALAQVPNNLPSTWGRERRAARGCRTSRDLVPRAGHRLDVKVAGAAVLLSLAERGAGPEFRGPEGQRRRRTASSSVRKSCAVGEGKPDGVEAGGTAERDLGSLQRPRLSAQRGQVGEPGAVGSAPVVGLAELIR